MFEEQIERSRQFWSNPPRWAYAIMAPWALGAVFGVYSSGHFYQVAGRQRTAEGEIVAHEPANHNRYGYTFSVGGIRYRGWESPRGQGWTLGQRVQVYYDPADPDTSALTDFGLLSWEAFGPVPMTSLGVVGALAVVFMLRHRAQIRNAS
jgi:uncharacterized protein DUF3592